MSDQSDQSDQGGQGGPRRARHLMDPTAPRKPTSRADLERLAKVQRRVLTALVVTTILHLSAGLAIASAHVDPDRLEAVVGLNVLAGLFGVVAVASGFAIHGRSLLSPWLLVGLVPGALGLAWVLLL